VFVDFQVLGPGPIQVTSQPASKLAHSENGLLGQIDLLQPGGTAVTATNQAPIGATSVSLAPYTVTAANAALKGNWRCHVRNWSTDSSTWTTTISGNVGPPPMATASFDLALLHDIFARVLAAAQLTVHVESDALNQPLEEHHSYITWSDAITDAVHLCGISPAIPDPNFAVTLPGGSTLGPVWRAVLDSDPSSVQLFVQGEPARLSATVSFLPGHLRGLGLTAPNIEISSLQVGLDVGFDGSLSPSCSVTATLPDVVDVDVSGIVHDQIVGDLNDKLGTYGPDVVRSFLDSFFGRLLRLQPVSQIKAYRTDGATLFVDHLPIPVVPPIGHTEPLVHANVS
jgi:hypothetical protein